MLESEERTPSALTYVVVCAVLIVLTLANILLALLDLRGWNTLLGLVIAAAQAVLSALYLMHLRWGRPMVRLVAVVALLWLGILIVGTLDDVITRGWLPVPGK